LIRVPLLGVILQGSSVLSASSLSAIILNATLVSVCVCVYVCMCVCVSSMSNNCNLHK